MEEVSPRVVSLNSSHGRSCSLATQGLASVLSEVLLTARERRALSQRLLQSLARPPAGEDLECNDASALAQLLFLGGASFLIVKGLYSLCGGGSGGEEESVRCCVRRRAVALSQLTTFAEAVISEKLSVVLLCPIDASEAVATRESAKPNAFQRETGWSLKELLPAEMLGAGLLERVVYLQPSLGEVQRREVLAIFFARLSSAQTTDGGRGCACAGSLDEAQFLSRWFFAQWFSSQAKLEPAVLGSRLAALLERQSLASRFWVCRLAASWTQGFTVGDLRALAACVVRELLQRQLSRQRGAEEDGLRCAKCNGSLDERRPLLETCLKAALLKTRPASLRLVNVETTAPSISAADAVDEKELFAAKRVSGWAGRRVLPVEEVFAATEKPASSRNAADGGLCPKGESDLRGARRKVRLLRAEEGVVGEEELLRKLTRKARKCTDSAAATGATGAEGVGVLIAGEAGTGTTFLQTSPLAVAFAPARKRTSRTLRPLRTPRIQERRFWRRPLQRV